MLLRRLPKGSARRYSAVAAAKVAAAPRFETKPHAQPVHPLQYTHINRMEELQHQPLTLLPTPLPEDVPQNEAYFPSSKKQQSLAVIAACLRDLYDVPRAEELFLRLRQDAKTGTGVLTIDTYNALLLAYAQLQAENALMAAPIQQQWSDKLWQLWDVLEQGTDRVALNATSVAIAFLAHVRAPNDDLTRPSTAQLLDTIVQKNLSVVEILSSPVLSTKTDHERVYNLLSNAAIENAQREVLELLKSRDQYTSHITPATGRTAISVPEVKPVQVKSKPAVNGTVTMDTPYNLKSLQTNLEAVQKAPDLVAWARQQELEASAYDTTIERLKHEMEQLEKVELGAASRLKRFTLQRWMYQWLQATEARLETDIKELSVKERNIAPSASNPLDAPLTPFLSLLEPSKLAIITILELMRLHGTGGVSEGMKTGRALISVGKAVENECMAVWGTNQQRGVKPLAEDIFAGTKKKKNARGRKKVLEENIEPASTTEAVQPVEPVEAVETEAAEEEVKTKKRGRKKKVMVEATAQKITEKDIKSPVQVISLESTQDILQAMLGTATTNVELGAETEPIFQDLMPVMPEWTQVVRVRVGSFLVDCLMASAFVTRSVVDENGNTYAEEQPAFMHGYEYIRGKKLGVIKLNSVVDERMARDSIRETLHPRHLPMLVKPLPWEDFDKGGYLTLRSTVMRIKDSVEQWSYLKHASAAGHVDFVYECLDALGETPWKINDKILNVVLEVWNQGEGMAGIPPAQLDVEEPPKPADFDVNPRERANYLLRMKQILTDQRNNHGERCRVNYKLEVARAFVNDEFYMPHNVDFRGRAYPIPPHLNHIGDDLSRGLLLFAEGRPLGMHGLRWLKIHLANVFGFDKASLDERVQFVERNIDAVRDSAEKPLEGDRWWLQADDPWQCLATCIELCDAERDGIPELYESHLPVHQDGTCNGLQHYAALGGDATGAQHVNLVSGDRPADVYSHVARMTEEVVKHDAEIGDPCAKLLQGKISRKVVKQTVMTTVYGVTFIGARDQIEKQLRDIVGISREDAWAVAAYLAKRVLGCIGDLFSGASQIQHWLSLSARLIAKSIPPDRIQEVLDGSPKDAARERMTSVIWTTALGLPIVQPYRKTKKKQILTAIQSVFISDPNLPTQVDPVKQSAAFPPNFVHSLDATHMMLTALECRAASITFASVHDSYWTHASTVDDMSAIIRDTFIALHSSDILQKLRNEFMNRYKGYRVPLSSLTDRDLCSILVTLAHPDHPAPPQLLSTIRVLVNRSPSRFAKEEATRRAMTAAREKLSPTELEAGVESVEGAVELTPEEQADYSGVNPSEEDLGVLEDQAKKPKRKPARRPKGQVAAWKLDPDIQYIELTDILPMLPDKGNFNVEAIKDSQYFFS